MDVLGSRGAGRADKTFSKKDDKSEDCCGGARGERLDGGGGIYLSTSPLRALSSGDVVVCQRHSGEPQTKTHHRRNSSIRSCRGLIGDQVGP